MTGKGQWIWLAEACGNAVNLRVLARKSVFLQTVSPAELLLSADSRYRLFVNGSWVTDGPARSFPWRYAYDRIDVTKFLQPGENVLAVVVHHFGEGTFQSLVTQPGLIAELHADGEVIGSDESWKIIVDPTYNQHSCRVTSQLFYEEHVDARHTPMGWNDVGFDDSAWPAAKVVASMAAGPWQLTPRDIPLLARETFEAVSVREVRTVRPPRFIRVLNLDRAFRPGNTNTGIQVYNGAVLTSIESSCDQTARWIQPTGVGCAGRYLNGLPVNETTTVQLHKGSNYLYATVEGTRDQGDFQILLEPEEDISLRNPLGEGEWAFAGPFAPADPDWEDKIYVGLPNANGKPACDPENPAFDALKAARTFEELREQGLLEHFNTAPAFAFVGPDVQAMIVNAIETETGDWEVLYDFGRELNAYFEMNLTAPVGVVIDATCFEAFRDGRPQYTGRYRVGFRYITREGEQTFTTFHHYGMRYLLLTIRAGETLPARLSVSAIFVHYPVEHRGTFACSDPVLNNIWTMGKHTLLCCMEDTFTDCPTYEQAYWVADARQESLVCYAAFGDTLLPRRCVTLVPQSLRQAQLTVGQVPSSWTHVMPTWSLLWVQMAWEYYLHSGDVSCLAEIYPGVETLLNRIRDKFTDERTGLFSIGAGNMFDWAAMDTLCKITANNNIFLVVAYEAAERMAAALNHPHDWNERAAKLKDNINRYLWSESRSAYIDSIHNDGAPSDNVSHPINTIALLYDIAPPERVRRIEPIVLGEITDNIAPFGSPFATFFLLEYLAKTQQWIRLIGLIHEKWAPMLENGSTTFWEVFSNPRSRCHGWSAGPTYILSRYLLGVHPAAPGYSKILIQPADLPLANIEGVVPTPHGDVAVQIRREGADVEMNVQFPGDIEADVRLPAAWQAISQQRDSTSIQIRANVRA